MIIQGDAAKVLKDFNDNCIDLTVTSPPYDKIRHFGGYTCFDFKEIACELYRVTKDGGVVVWIINDSTVDGNESGTSFRQALYFKKIGFKLHDTMIYANSGNNYSHPKRYSHIFQYMFVFSKGFVKTFNGIKDRKNNSFGEVTTHKIRIKTDDSKTYNSEKFRIPRYGLRYNVWFSSIHGHNITNDIMAFDHPSVMPEQLAADHIKSWSNEGDLILDPFAGSGTTLKAAHQLNRKYIGIEINPEYVVISKKRLTYHVQQQRLEQFIR